MAKLTHAAPNNVAMWRWHVVIVWPGFNGEQVPDTIVSMITELHVKFVYLTFLFNLRPMEIKGIQERGGVKDP